MNEDLQLESYLPLVHRRVYAFRRCGVESDDLFQEGIIGLLSAIRAYRPEHGATFETFAYTCITNRLRSAAIAAGRTIQAISLEEQSPIPNALDPQEIVVSQEETQRWNQMLSRRLSPLERSALELCLNGYSYEEIAARLGQPSKAIDNALQRARRKLRR